MRHGRRLLTCAAAIAIAASLPLVPAHAGPVKPPVPQTGTYDPMRSFAPMVEAIEPAVVAIEVETQARAHDEIPELFRRYFGERFGSLPPRKGEGSGFVISADGLVLTNAHVIEGAQRITAIFADGERVSARVLGKDGAMDVALLRLESDRDWDFVELGSSAELKVGDWVLAVGNPLGLGNTVTAGIVSGKGRVLGQDVFGNEDFIQTDAAINRGNSGGPLFDLSGKVVGINTAIIAGANTVGFAIPVDLVKSVLHDLEEKGKVARGYLGVRPQNLDRELASAMNVQDAKGALVSQVFADTPAEKYGLRTGDIIVAVGDQSIESPADLVAAVGNRRPGEAIELSVLRNGERKRVKLVLGERPGEDEMVEPRPTERKVSLGSLGVGLRDIPTSVAAELGVAEGVLVDTVARGSAADGKLSPGDVILEVNRRKVRSPAEVARIVSRSTGNVTLLVMSAAGQRFVVLPLG